MRIATSVFGLLIILLLCASNYLALTNSEFRAFFGGNQHTETQNEAQKHDRAPEELAQIALLLGVTTLDAAANVKFLLEKNQKSSSENALLHQKLGAAEKLHSDLEAKHKDLEARHLHLEKSKAELESKTKAAAKKLSVSTASRATRSVARHVGGAAGESIPVLGTAIVATMLALDVKDACDQVRELNELNRAVGSDIEDEQQVCGIRIPDQKQLAAEVSRNWQSAYQRSATAIGKPPSIPEVSWNDLKVQVCAVTPVPMVCH